MATGIDGVASVVALISFSVSVFQGCVTGYQILSAAKHAEQDVARVRCFLQWEELRLVEWGQRANIDGRAEDQNPYLPWQLIRSTLEELYSLLSDVNKLQSKYGLTPVAKNVENAAGQQGEGRRGIAKLWSYASVEARALRARSAQKPGPIQKLKWVLLDQEKIVALISELARLNDQLYNVLESRNQDFIRGTLSVLLQDLIARTNYSQDLEALKTINNERRNDNAKAIESAANLKQARINIKYDQRADERLMSDPPKVKITRLKLDALSSILVTGNREVASYNSNKRNINSWVLLEWKTVTREQRSKLRYRVESVTSLLERATDPRFGTLRCLGYVARDTEINVPPAYAYAYELEKRAGVSEKDPPSMQTLYDCIQSTVATRTRNSQDRIAPSLTARMQYAQHVSDAVLQLHTAGWLHKSIRSTNLVFITSAHSSTRQGPFVVGFEYSRADSPLEMTETPTQRPETDLYRHPDLLGPNRSDFCKAFDLYSLGCVLTEIALWQPISMTAERLLKAANGDWNAEENFEALLPEIAFAAGDTYAQAVRLCFFPRTENENADEDEDPEDSIGNEMEISRLIRLVLG